MLVIMCVSYTTSVISTLSIHLAPPNSSTQITSLPLSAKQVPVTRPTYPVPIIPIFINNSNFNVVFLKFPTPEFRQQPEPYRVRFVLFLAALCPSETPQNFYSVYNLLHLSRQGCISSPYPFLYSGWLPLKGHTPCWYPYFFHR